MRFTRDKKPQESAYITRSREIWEKDILKHLEEYISIPNKSPAYDPEWKRNGHMDKAVALYIKYAEEQKKYIPGLTVEKIEIEGRTPLIIIQAPGTIPEAGEVLFYGHLDKQPEAGEWREGLDPWKPVREGDRLYGRGASDDGYAMFSALASLRILAENKVDRPATTIIIEASEESGSTDLEAHLKALGDRIGNPDTVICLDGGAGSYDRMWQETSMRGVVNGTLEVEYLKESEHSGNSPSPSTERISRILLDRIEDKNTGEILIESLNVPIPDNARRAAEEEARTKGDAVFQVDSRIEGTQPVVSDPVEFILNHTWKPELTVTGSSLPFIKDAGNVKHAKTTLKLSMRIPPGVDPMKAFEDMKAILEHDTPYGAKATFSRAEEPAAGWASKNPDPAFQKSVSDASEEIFGKSSASMGGGATIPFVALFAKLFPDAQFLVTGVLGPESNAHGPNEFLHVPTAEKLTACNAKIMADKGQRGRERRRGR